MGLFGDQGEALEVVAGPPVALVGDMDMATATAALAAITEVLRPDLNGRLLIDVSGLGYVDSAGLALFMNIVKLKGQPIVLRNPTPMFTKLLEVTALVSSGWFEIGDDSLE